MPISFPVVVRIVGILAFFCSVAAKLLFLANAGQAGSGPTLLLLLLPVSEETAAQCNVHQLL